MAVLKVAEGPEFQAQVPILIIGGGACGMVAALAAKDSGVTPVIVERDTIPGGSTALSSGMIPACGTRQQTDHNITDTVQIMCDDIQHKAKGEADAVLVQRVCELSGPLIDWLCVRHNLNLTLVEGFLYPGHSALRMHAPPSRAGVDLMADLGRAVAAADITVMTQAHVTDLYASPDGGISGVRIVRPDGAAEHIGCDALILACNGFGGNPAMVQDHIPKMVSALYFGHQGNQGDAINWGQALGAATRHLGAYQGHGSVAEPYGILISWALMMQGGLQINRDGKRFSNEHSGYSEQARRVIAQPSGFAWNLFDDRLLDLGRGFEDFRQAEALGAIQSAPTIPALAEMISVPAEQLAETLELVAGYATRQQRDIFGRGFSQHLMLEPPYHALKVTGALFHTQGGLVVDAKARVLRRDGTLLPNLLAGGGAACGVSGSEDWGYLSGNGLLTAVTLGYRAGLTAADLVR
jgi:fumarate reductase flavoprotein subunit